VATKFEVQPNNETNIVWTTDKSGNFLTSNEKVGTILMWNVAQKEPLQIIKVGSAGIQCMRILNVTAKQARSNNAIKIHDQQRILVSLRNGAVMVFNLNKRCIEFQTEAGHSETIFDVEFCISNPDYMASCSYDGTIRVWDANRMNLVSVCDT